MSEHSADDPHQQWSRFWESASGFWRGLRSWRVWLLCAALVAIVVLQLYVQFRFNYWNRDFFDALETQALLLIPLCIASVALAVASVWGRMTVQRKWRGWLTTYLIDFWADNDRYSRLAQVQANSGFLNISSPRMQGLQRTRRLILRSDLSRLC
jgi:putative ATP-binding cassette transporter